MNATNSNYLVKICNLEIGIYSVDNVSCIVSNSLDVFPIDPGRIMRFFSGRRLTERKSDHPLTNLITTVVHPIVFNSFRLRQTES